MKSTRLFEAIGDIDEKYVTEATNHRRKSVWLSVGAIAACVAVTISVAFAVTHYPKHHLISPSDDPLPQSQPQASLPILHLTETGEGGMGEESYLAPSFDHLRFHSPWREEQNIRTLPVYDNSRQAAWYTADGGDSQTEEDVQAMQAELLRIGALLGMDTENPVFEKSLYGGQELSDGYYRVEIDNTRLSIHIPMENGSPLHPHADYDTLYTTAEGLLEEYKAVIGMKDPQLNIGLGDYTINCEQYWQVQFFDAVDDPTEALLNYNFRQGMFFYNASNQELNISFDRYDLSSVIGDYPLITVQQAKDALAEGYFVSSCFEPYTGTDTICRVELVYRNAPWDTVFVPYYKFYIESTSTLAAHLGLKLYTTCYVPAVERQYIDGLPLWDGSINN